LQFAFISITALPAPLFAPANGTNGKKSVPMSRWAYIAFLFYSINMLNNWAFAFNISVPVHIILRSFGSVTTMLAGVVRGKRYSKLQVSSVVLLTVGVLVSAWADSMSKVCISYVSNFVECQATLLIVTTTGQIDEG
jgi:UDP-xylose/UDP-N-acetylglucosamine transporter B4